MIIEFEGQVPNIHPNAYVVESAQIIGDVTIGEDSSVWFNTVIRGDIHSIVIGDRTNIQDLSMIHVTGGKWPTHLGDEITVGHRVVLHGCTIEDRCLIGMGSVIMDGAVIGEGSLVAASSLVTPGFTCEPGTLVMGHPAKEIRPLNEKEKDMIEEGYTHYAQYARRYRRGSKVVGHKDRVSAPQPLEGEDIEPETPMS